MRYNHRHNTILTNNIWIFHLLALYFSLTTHSVHTLQSLLAVVLLQGYILVHPGPVAGVCAVKNGPFGNDALLLHVVEELAGESCQSLSGLQREWLDQCIRPQQHYCCAHMQQSHLVNLAWSTVGHRHCCSGARDLRIRLKALPQHSASTGPGVWSPIDSCVAKWQSAHSLGKQPRKLWKIWGASLAWNATGPVKMMWTQWCCMTEIDWPYIWHLSRCSADTGFTLSTEQHLNSVSAAQTSW